MTRIVSRGAALLLCVLVNGGVATAGVVDVPGSYATIQGAIDAAPDGSLIQVAPGHYHERLVLNGVSKTLTIRGNTADPSAVVVDGDGAADSVLRVVSCGSNVAFEGLTITGGHGGPGIGGGLFLANSQAVFRECVFQGNQSEDGGGAYILTSGGLFDDCTFAANGAARYGGAVLMTVQASTVFQNCRFTGNASGMTDFTNGWGGAVYAADSSPTFLRSTITGNQAKYAAGGIAIVGHFDFPVSRPVLVETTLEGNQVVRGGSSYPAAEGGGMHIEDNVVATLERCQVRGNHSNSGGGLNSYRARYEIRDSVIEGNDAAPIVAEGIGGFGGGLYIISVNVAAPTRPASTIEIDGSLVRDNTAQDGAGMFVQGDFQMTANRATLDLNDSVVAANVASRRGGGIFVDRTVATIRRTSVLSNQVTAGATSWGGGLVTIGSSITTIDDATIAGNVVGVIGGAIFADQGGQLNVTSSRFYGNTAGSAAGYGGGALAVAQAAGPTPGPVAGSIQDSVFADDGSHWEIWEANVPGQPAPQTTITYLRNRFRAGGGVYYANNFGGLSSVAQFEAGAPVGGRAQGNTSGAPGFAVFTAAPSTIVAGTTPMLAWCAPDSTGLTVDHGVGAVSAPTGGTDVQPTATTTFTLSGARAGVRAATVAVACPGVGVSVPLAPSNGATSLPTTGAALSWTPAAVGALYDVYLDTADDPSTRVAQGVSATTFTASGLAPSTTYRWRVVPSTASCPTGTAGPVFSFRTCPTNAPCSWTDTLDDGDASDWTASGKGLFVVEQGQLRAYGKHGYVVAPPPFPMGDGTIDLTLALIQRRFEARVLFAFRDAKNYRILYVRGNSGQLRLEERVNGARRRIANARTHIPLRTLFNLSITTGGGQARVQLNGQEVLAGVVSGSPSGTIAFQAERSGIAIDRVQLTADGAN